eukprot:5343924-Amphidinium_carterae.3
MCVQSTTVVAEHLVGRDGCGRACGEQLQEEDGSRDSGIPIVAIGGVESVLSIFNGFDGRITLGRLGHGHILGLESVTEDAWSGSRGEWRSRAVQGVHGERRGGTCAINLAKSAYRTTTEFRWEDVRAMDGATDVRFEKRGRKLLSVLAGAALNAAFTQSDEDLTGINGTPAILRVLDIMLAPCSEAWMQQTCAITLYEGNIKGKRSCSVHVVCCSQEHRTA